MKGISPWFIWMNWWKMFVRLKPREALSLQKQCKKELFKFSSTLIISQLNFQPMLRYAAIFFVIAIIAAIFGFGGIAAGAASIAKILFYIFLVLFLVTIIFGA